MKQLSAALLLASSSIKSFSLACRNTPKPPVQNWQSEGKRRKTRIK